MNRQGVAGSLAVAGRLRNSTNVPHVPYEPSQQYKKQAMYLLKKDFPFLSVQAMSLVFQENQYDFTGSFEDLKAIRSLLGTEGLELIHRQYPCLRYINKIEIQKARQKMKHTQITDETLLEELDQIPEFNRKENVPPSSKKKKEIIVIDDDENTNENKEPELECACCFSECPIENIVQCTEAHLFCLDCLS